MASPGLSHQPAGRGAYAGPIDAPFFAYWRLGAGTLTRGNARFRPSGQGRPYPKTDRKGDTLGAINLGQRSYRRVGHSHLQGARKRQADHDDGARQHADRDQSAFAVASHNKRAHPWLNGEPHRQRDNLLNRPKVGKRNSRGCQ